MSTIKRTYGSRPRRQPQPSSHPSDLTSSPPCTRPKRPLEDQTLFQNIPPPAKRVKVTEKTEKEGKHKKKTFTQLHFSIDASILRTCSLCQFSYTKGAPQDESLHRTHCARVQRGMEWGREEEREKIKWGVVEVASGVPLKDGSKGRIISFRADVGGRIKSKLASLLETINLALSSPPLTPKILQASKAYLFLIPTTSAGSPREKIVGCVIAQRISTAMAIASPEECATTSVESLAAPPIPAPSLITVDETTSLFVHPAPLPTPLGICRLFVARTHRRGGIALKLLSAAAETFVHGCPLDPKKGEVAFTQPTRAGAVLMKRWGEGRVRIYEE